MKFLKDEPALLLDDLESKTLVLADLHLGIEYEIYRKGISIPPRMEKQKKRILQLLEETEGERIVLLGDVKHNIPSMSIGEKEKLPSFLESLTEEGEVHVAKGNHDGMIEDLAPGDVRVHGTSGFKLDKYYFNHGHAWPDPEALEAKTLIRGHSHPAVEFKDKLGFSSILPCWIKSRIDVEKLAGEMGGEKRILEKSVIVPSFNELISGMSVNKEMEESLLGPLLRNKVIDLGGGKAYLLDGTFLGKVSEI